LPWSFVLSALEESTQGAQTDMPKNLLQR